MQTRFPSGKQGAISFTYDDGLDEHLDLAMPELESAGLRGSFYVPTRQTPSSAWSRRPEVWRAATQRGHEIGNHTQHHPCRGAFAWVKTGHARELYDLARMEAELIAANEDLRQVVGPAAGQTHAFTCCEDWVGPDHTSSRPLVDKLFVASRGGPSAELADPANLDFRFVPSWQLTLDIPLPAIVQFIDRAIAERKWAVLMFHGVGGGGHRLDVTRATHQAICRHVAARQADLWCDTFVNIARHLRGVTHQSS
ncbi:polysaccharide deacetylase family protein [soil metagenome]